MSEGSFSERQDRRSGSDPSPPESASEDVPPRVRPDPKHVAKLQAAYRDLSTDRQARDIIRSFLSEGEPFALYLRSFREEATDAYLPHPDLDPTERIFTVVGGPSTLEQSLAEALEGRARVITTRNPSAYLLFRLLLHDGHSFPRLELAEPNWTRTMAWLIEAASFIVFEVDFLAPGVVQELDLVQALGREQSTVIVVPSPDAPDFDLFFKTVVTRGGGTLPNYEIPDAHSPALSRFSWVIREDHCCSDLRSWQPFAQLLSAYDSMIDSELDTDMLRRLGELASKWGVNRHEDYVAANEALATTAISTLDAGAAEPLKAAGGLDPEAVALLALVLADDDALAAVDAVADRTALSEALDSLAVAVRHFGDAGDNAGQAGALMNIGRIFLEVGQYHDAIAAFRDSGTISKRDKNDAGEPGFRQAVAWVALAHCLDGDLERASAFAFHVLEVERSAGETVATIDALNVLRQIYAQAGEEESERNVIADLEVASQRIKNQVRLGEHDW